MATATVMETTHEGRYWADETVGLRRGTDRHGRGGPRAGRRQMYTLDEAGRRLILAKYDGRSETIEELCRRLRVPRWRVKRWAAMRGLCKPGKKQPDWSEREIAYLESVYHRISVEVIARNLGRTVTGVRLKAKRLGIRKTGEGLTMRGLCEALGCDHHKVERWLRDGWLVGTRRQTERVGTQLGDIWLFREKDVRAFVAEHPAEIDPRRIDWPWMVDLLINTKAAQA